MAFSHSLLWQQPIATLSFFALIMSFVSLWIKRTGWLWGAFLVIAMTLAFEARILIFPALLPIFALFTAHFLLKHPTVQGPLRFSLILLVVAISLGLWFHLFPGFNNWKIVDQEVLSPRAVPCTLWLNFDKPLIGLFILAWSLPLLRSKTDWLRVARRTLPLSVLGIGCIMFLAIYGDIVRWDPKVPTIFIVWTIENLVLVCMPEEAFYRGFVQEELFKWLGKKMRWANIGAVVLTALFFMLLHLNWVKSIPFLTLVFATGIIYGAIYQYTRAIESSIFCHFMLNWIHFIFFTYPALAK